MYTLVYIQLWKKKKKGKKENEKEKQNLVTIVKEKMEHCFDVLRYFLTIPSL